MGGYKRVSPNEALLKRTPSTSSCAAPSASYLSPAARRRWSSVSTPVTPMLGSPAHTPRVRSPIRTYSPLPVVSPSRPYSSCGYYRSRYSISTTLMSFYLPIFTPQSKQLAINVACIFPINFSTFKHWTRRPSGQSSYQPRPIPNDHRCCLVDQRK